jgi:thiamine-phosphate pyrophosphorylase
LWPSTYFAALPNLPRIKTPMTPLLCAVTDRHSLAERSQLSEYIALAVAAGIDWIQIREKDLSARELLAVARGAVKVAAARENATRIIVNDRLDVAIASGAGGVHLGEASMPVAAVNPWRREAVTLKKLPREFLIGASCHSVEAARAAERDGADYVIFGPVFSTPSKEKLGAPQGIKRLAEVSNSVKIPVLAIGGITEENAGECVKAGASGIAAIRMFSGERDLAALVRRLKTL